MRPLEALRANHEILDNAYAMMRVLDDEIETLEDGGSLTEIDEQIITGCFLRIKANQVVIQQWLEEVRDNARRRETVS